MSCMSAAYIQRLQRLYLHFKKHTGSILEGVCSLVELIDEDDLTNWYVLLRYEDENRQEFFVSLRLYFFDELQRMPLVFVIAPRLVAAFIHHGAICSLELMSQRWAVDAEGLALLLRALHATLNPFTPDSRVTVDETGGGIRHGNNNNNNNHQHNTNININNNNNNNDNNNNNNNNSSNNNQLRQPEQGFIGEDGGGVESTMVEMVTVSAYTREEHELGIQHIRQSHPHLFRGYAVRQSHSQNKSNTNSNNNNNDNKNNFQNLQEQNREDYQKISPQTITPLEDTVTAALTSSFILSGDNEMKGNSKTRKVVVNSREKLERLFREGGNIEVQLDVQNASSASSVSTTSEMEDDIITCILPSENSGNPKYTISIGPFHGIEVNDSPGFMDSKQGTETLNSTKVERVKSSSNTLKCEESQVTSDIGYEKSWGDQSYEKKISNESVEPELRSLLTLNSNSIGDMEGLITSQEEKEYEGENKHESKCTDWKKSISTIPLVLTGVSTGDNGNKGDLLPNTRKSRIPESPCVIPVGCTLRLKHLTIYGAFTVLGTLEMHECIFIGYFSTEGRGRVQLSHCEVYIDVPESRREGILILDASTVELRDNTNVHRKEYTFIYEQESIFVGSTVPFLLQAFILVSNSGSLRIEGGCNIASYCTEKTIYAEQDASVDISSCSILAGYSSAVTILGCRAFFTNTRFYGGDRMEPRISDVSRPTGLNVELGGLVTARNCQSEYLYFGFSVIAHSVAHFYACHAEHVVNGYTIDASSVTIENSSARTNHVGVFVLNKAKCNISNDMDHIMSFEERCSLFLQLRGRSDNLRLHAQVDDDSGNSKISSFNCNNNSPRKGKLNAAKCDIQKEKEEDLIHHNNNNNNNNNDSNNQSNEKGERQLCEKLNTTFESSVMSPISFTGGLFSLEVRDASMVAKGMVLTDAQDTSIYIYDQGSLTLSETIVWARQTPSQQPCGLKVVNSRAQVHRCLVTDYTFGFAAIQGSSVRLEECMVVGGTNGFTVDDAHCIMQDCGADTEHVGVFSLNQSILRMDNSNAPKRITGGLPCVLRGRVHGLESRSSDTICIGVIVQRGLDSGFTCYNGGCLRLEKCIVDMSAAVNSEQHTTGEISRRPHSSSAVGQSCSTSLPGVVLAHHHHPPSSSGNGVVSKVSTNTNTNNININNTNTNNNNNNNTNVGTISTTRDDNNNISVSSNTQKNSGVKAWSGSRCIVIGCEVRHVTFGYAAIGPDTELEASHCTAKHIVNGFTVDSAKCRLSRCSTNSNHVGVFVLSHGTCTVRRGSYTARMYSIENRNGTVHVEGHVKLSGFSRIGLYVYDGARLDTMTDSMLDIKVRKDPAQQQIPPQLTLTGASANPSGLFPSCFAMDRGNAVIHNAYFGGGAQCAVSCGDGANVYLHQCTAEFCNIAFNALSGSQMYLSDCRAQHVRQHALIVHRGGVSRISCQAPVSPTTVLQGKFQIDGKCFLEHVVLRPIPEGYNEFSPSTTCTTTTTTNNNNNSGASAIPQSSSQQGGTSLWSSFSFSALNTPLSPPLGLIRVTGSGTLVMDWCLLLLEDSLYIGTKHGENNNNNNNSDMVGQQVIVADGKRASVQLRNVLFQQIHVVAQSVGKNSDPIIFSRGNTILKDTFQRNGKKMNKGKKIWYGLTLQQGAKGEFQGCSDITLFSNTFSSLHTSTCDNLHETFQVTNQPSPMSFVEGDDGVTSVPNSNFIEGNIFTSDDDFKKGSNAICGGDMIPLCVHVGRGSFLLADNVHLRQVIGLDGSSIDATRCFFAGAQSVQLTSGSTLRAVESVFVSSVRGPALSAENATISLVKCRVYAIYREAIMAKYTTLTLQDTVCIVFTSSMSNRGVGGGKRLCTTHLDQTCGLSKMKTEENSSNNNNNIDNEEEETEEIEVIKRKVVSREKNIYECVNRSNKDMMTSCTDQGDVTMPQTAAPTCSMLESAVVDRRILISPRLPFLSHVNREETQPDVIVNGTQCCQQQNDTINDFQKRLFRIKKGNNSFENNSTEDEVSIQINHHHHQDVTSVVDSDLRDSTPLKVETKRETGDIQYKPRESVHLDHSRLYYSGTTIIEGGIILDAASRVVMSRSSRFMDFFHLIKEKSMHISALFFGTKQQHDQEGHSCLGK